MPRTVWDELLRALIDGLYDGLDVKHPVREIPGIPGTNDRLKVIDPAALKRIESDRKSKPPLDMVKGRDGVWRVAKEPK